MAFPILLASFILVPVLEIALLIRVGSAIGVGSTLLFVIFTAVLGAYLVRQQGFATLSAVQNEMNAGRMPALQMAEGVALLFAGAVLLTPGFFTDAIGFALLTPFIRRAIIKWGIARSNISMHAAGASQSSASPSNGPMSNDPMSNSSVSSQQKRKKPTTVIEGEYSDLD